MNFKRTTAAVIAAAAAASISVCAYAESDVTFVEDVPFELKYENFASADGYDDEARAVFNYYGVDPNTTDLKDVFHGVLAADSTFTVDFEDDTEKESALPSFTLFKFSEDGTTLLPQYLVYTHPHPATVDYVWKIDGVKVLDGVKGEPYTVDGQIDGIDYNTSRCIEGYTTVLGNKISGNLIKKLYEESVAGAKGLSSDYYTDEQLEVINDLPSYDECDAVAFAITFGDNWYNSLYLTESYVKNHPLTPDAPESEDKVSDTEPTVGDCTGDLDDSGNTSDDNNSGNNPNTGVAVAVTPAILAAGALAAAAIIRKKK